MLYRVTQNGRELRDDYSKELSLLAINSNFFITISLHPDDLKLRHFTLSLFNQT